MHGEGVKLGVPFETLANSVATLTLKDKRRLLQLLDEQVGQAEEEEWEKNPAVQAEMREARAAYEAGDYVTIEDYLARRKKKT
ncbi:MAG: hypothetical protein FJ279_07555 [Planctomycetes bacterium]|nr:hypothetical protein [Planctomycetota bacterium]